MARILVGLVLILWMAVPAVALLPTDVVADFRVIKNKVGPGEWAMFELHIENRGVAYDVFNIVNDLEGIEWSMLTEPQSRTGIIIKGKGTEKIKILLKDLNLTRSWRRPYFVTVFVETKDRAVRKTMKLPVYLMPGPVVEGVYFDVIPDIPERIDPRKTQSLKLIVKNNNWYEYSDVRVAVKTADFERESFLSFAPNETKSVEFTVSFDPATPPKQEKVAITVSVGGVVYYIGEKTYEIVAYNTPFVVEPEKKTSFLKMTETLTVTNTDNVEQTQTVSSPVSRLESLLGSAVPNAGISDVAGIRSYVWPLTLPPAGSAVLTLTTNYRLILYAVLILAVVIFLWHMFQSPVVVVKRAEFVKTKQGAITEIDVRLNIENKGKKELRNVKLIEHVPHIMKIVWKPKHTFRPKKSATTPHGQSMVWEFDLTAKEERILSYTLAPRLSVIGELRLDSATLKYHYDNHEFKAHSNEVYVTNVQMDEKES